jgi:hypothetical protein
MRRALVVLTVLWLAVPAARAQVASGDGTDRWLTLQWTLDGRHISGRIYNGFFRAADKIRLRVESLDAADHVVAERYEWVGGGVPALGNRFFELPVPPGGDHYRVVVSSYTFVTPRRF